MVSGGWRLQGQSWVPCRWKQDARVGVAVVREQIRCSEGAGAAAHVAMLAACATVGFLQRSSCCGCSECCYRSCHGLHRCSSWKREFH